MARYVNPLPGNASLPNGESKAANREIRVHRISGWHSRGYLPHFEGADAIQHVTFHLADSLPQSVLHAFEEELKTVPAERRDAARRMRIEAWIDAGHGSCVLRVPQIASIVQQSLLAFDSTRYRLMAWVVMPNHVHVLIQPIGGWTTARIVASWKKFTARRVRDYRLEREGKPGGSVWHREYWDRYIRDMPHFERALEYIHLNPVKAGLAATADKWRWSSAYAGNKIANREIGVPRSFVTT